MKIRTFVAFVAGNMFAYGLAVAVVSFLDNQKAEANRKQWADERLAAQQATTHTHVPPGGGWMFEGKEWGPQV